MIGWFDGLFQGAAEAENRLARSEAARQDSSQPGGSSQYLAGFRQGVLDARAVAALRRSQARRREGCVGPVSGFDEFDPRT
jgi:hypothetical protein